MIVYQKVFFQKMPKLPWFNSNFPSLIWPIKCQCRPHIETSQLNGFYMRATLAFNGLMVNRKEENHTSYLSVLQPSNAWWQQKGHTYLKKPAAERCTTSHQRFNDMLWHQQCKIVFILIIFSFNKNPFTKFY